MSCFQISESSALQSSGVETQEVEQTVGTVVLEKGKYQMVLRKVSVSSESDCSDESESSDSEQSGESDVESEAGVGDVEDEESSVSFTEADLASFALSVTEDDVVAPKKPLKVYRPFVPQFHSSMSIEVVNRVASMEGVTDEMMLEKGYPQYLLSKIRKCAVREVPINPFKVSTKDRNLYGDASPESNSVSAKASKVRSVYEIGEVANVWIVPNRYGAKAISKPVRYSRRTFMAWCLGKARFLYETVTKKTQVVTGNNACRTLFFESGAINQRVADMLIQKAEVYIQDFNKVDRSEGVLTLGHFSDHPLIHSRTCFKIGTATVSSVEEAMKFQSLFKRHGPIFRRLIAALQGDVTVDVVTLQATINQKVLSPDVAGLLVKSQFQGLKSDSLVILPSRVETRYQGNLCPRRVTVGHQLVDAEGHDRKLQADVKVKLDVSNLTEMFNTVAPSGESMLRSSVKIVSFLTAIITSKDIKTTSAILTMFVSSDPALFKYVGNKVSYALTGVTMLQGTFDNVFQAITQSLSGFWDVVVCSTILALLRECKDSLFSVVGPLVSDLVKETKRAIGRETAMNIGKTLFAWIGDIMGRLKECAQTRSMAPIWGDKWNANTWMRHALSYERFYVTLTTIGSSPNVLKEITGYKENGFIPEFWSVPKSVDDFIAICDDHLSQGNKIKEYFGGHPEVIKGISAAQAKLSAFVDGVRMSNGSRGERVAPMGFFFSGSPGVGKTNLMMQIIQSLGRQNNIPCDAKSTYLWQVGVNFQDGFNHTHSWVIMDDIDAGVASAAAGVPTHVESVINLINHKPCPVEQADLSLKGKVFGSPMGLLYATNFEDGRAPTYSLEPHAFYRRFKWFIKVVVKKEFATEGGLMDVTKATESETHDMYELHVSRYCPSKDPAVFKTEAEVMSLPQFMLMAQEEFAAHLKRETMTIQKRAKQVGHCPKCGLSTDRACCGYDKMFLRYQGSDAEEAFEDYHTVKSELSEEKEDFHSATSEKSDETFERWGSFYHGDDDDVEALIDNRLHYFNMDVLYKSLSVQWLKDFHGARVTNAGEYCQALNLAALLMKQGELPSFEFLCNANCRPDNLIAEMCFLEIVPEVGYPDRRRLSKKMRAIVPVTTVTDRVFSLKAKVESSLGITPSRWVDVVEAFVLGCVGIYALQKLFGLVEHISSKIASDFQGREGNVNASAPVPTDWQRADQKFKPGVPASFGQATYTLEDLEKAIAECYVSVSAIKDGRVLSMHATVIAPGWIAVPTHLIHFSRDVTVVQNDVQLPCKVLDDDVKVFPSNPELCLLRVPGLRACIALTKKMWFNEDAAIQQFDSFRIYANGLKYSPTSAYVRSKGIAKVIQTNVVTQNGDCGMLYVGCHNGSYRIVGMHYALDKVTSAFNTFECSIGGLLTGREIVVLCQSVGTLFQGVQYVLTSFSTVPEDLQFGKFGKYSEIWAAKSQSDVKFHAFGEMTPPIANSSMKSKVKQSILYPHIKDVITELCGRDDYWKVPIFRGSMVEGVWRSPFTNMFASQNLKRPDPFFMKLAVYDYVNGIDLLDRTGYAVLSEEQMLTGIPGSYINSINMKTSAGPPLKGGKRSHFFLDSLDGSYASPEIWKMFDSIEEVLSQGDIPVVLSICAMKDEPLKYSKDFPRIFNVLPAAMNLVMKKHGSAWKSFMRANFQFFESAVGINMTSAECNKVLEFMRIVSPDLTRLFDADAVAMDKSWSEVCFEFVAIAIFVMSAAIGVSPFENYALAKSMCYTVYSVKNDLFNVANNPSGNDMTVELNGLMVALGERYVYYRTRGFEGDRNKIEEWFANVFEEPIHEYDETLTFRKDVALSTYGDDNLKAMRYDPTPNYEDVWANEIGIVMTDASKIGKMRQKNVSEISFLKRDFVKLEGIDGYVAKLSKFSMGRMLMMKKDSTLGDADHSAVVLSEFFREALYHGREFYQSKLSQLVPVAEQLGLTTNPYYDVRSFDERLKEAQEGNYQTWSLREPVPRRELITEQTFQGIMSNLTFANGSNFDPSASSADTTITHSVGSITTSSSVLQDHMVGTAKYLQNVPTTDLNAVLTRATLIADYPISNADAFNTDVLTIDPWNLYLANAVVAAKLQNFSYIRGTLQLIFVTTVPGMSYGMYTVSALPNGGALAAGESACGLNLITANCLQLDHCAVISCSDSNSVVLQLPFIGPYDYWAMPGAGTSTPIEAWKVICRTWRPLNTTVSGGVTSGRIQVYANLMEDYQLAVPRFQGKHKLIANDTLKRMAPSLHDKIGEGKGSKMMGAIASVAESAAAIPVIGAFASTAGTVARGAEAVLSWLGFTVYSNEETPKYLINRSIGNVAHTEGEDSGFAASLSVQSEISIDPSLSGPYGPSDCLSFGETFARWTWVKSMDWPTTAVSQTDLGSLYVSPFTCLTGGGGACHLTPAGYVGLPFEYWRGDMEYKIVIPVASTHRGKLQVFWTPQGSNATGDVTNVSYNTIFDVAAGPMKTITIGFSREKPFLRSSIITDSLAILPIGDANGALQFRVINPLTSSSSTASTTIFVFARAKANMEFAVPRDFVKYKNAAGTGLFSYSLQAHTKLQGALGDDDNATSEEAIVLVPESGDFPSDLVFFGEKVKSCRELLQKPSKLPSAPYVNGSLQIACPFPTPQSTSVGSLLNVWTWQGHYRALFYGLSFSERWKVLTLSPAWVGASRNQYDVSYEVVSTMAPLTFTGPTCGSEFRLPYYHNEKFLRGYVSSTPAASKQISKLCLFGTPTVDPTVTSTWYYSWGPDIRATCFRQVPGVVFSETPIAGFTAMW